MLSWLSGDQPTADIEPPETPAHTFVTRAFKHAIWGTPGQPQTQRPLKPRTQSMDDRRPQQPFKPRQTTGAIKTSETRARANSMDESPARRPGILLTPGTGGNRRKSVTFDPGDAKKLVLERDGQAQPDAKGPRVRGLRAEDFTSRLRGSYQPPTMPQPDARDTVNDGDVTLDLSEPRSKSGKYWKEKFENLDKSATLDIRKLKKKEEVAKKFGLSQESEAKHLEEDLKREQARADELQHQVEDFRLRMKSAVSETTESGKQHNAPRRRTKDEIMRGASRSSLEPNDLAELEELRAKKAELEKSLAEQRKVATAHLKGKESEIARLRKALEESEKARQEAEMANKKAEDELTQQRHIASQHLHKKEREISRLQRDLEASRSRSQPSKHASESLALAKIDQNIPKPDKTASVPASDPASDIWADAGGAEKAALAQRSPRRRQPPSQLRHSDNPDYDTMNEQRSPARRAERQAVSKPARMPLGHRTVTSLNADSAAAGDETPRTKDAMTEERMRAARRRLEAREQSKRSTALGLGASE